MMLRVFQNRGIKELFRSLRNRFIASQQPSHHSLEVGDWLTYYRNRNEIYNSKPIKSDLSSFPMVSILILTYNNLSITQICLHSIYCNTTYPNFEIILVDNGSADSSPAWLESFAKSHQNLKLILNSENAGFAAGNNQAARAASGEYLIFLNNDTIVTEGWIERFLAHIQNNLSIGLIGPVTNSTGNEARVPIDYESPVKMEKYAAERARSMSGKLFDIRMLAFFCVMARKVQFEDIGELDERFGVGMFEDDDLAVRYQQKQLRVVCAEDVFIHHFQGASFGKLENSKYTQLFEENRRKYEEKWGKKWEPYRLRRDPFLLS